MFVSNLVLGDGTVTSNPLSRAYADSLTIN